MEETMTDRTTKALLFAIAVALWAQLLAPLVTIPATAQGMQWDNPGYWLGVIANGTCANRKLC